MIRVFAKWYGKWKYVLAKETEGAMHEWSAKVAEKNASMTRDLIAHLTKDADAMEARINQVVEMEEKGYWECENGHESAAQFNEGARVDPLTDKCDCGAQAKFIKRETMSGQEKYDSDKDRKEAEKMLEARRAEIASQEKELENQVATVKYFRGQSESSRKLAENLRKV
jgi:hypothetical protein